MSRHLNARTLLYAKRREKWTEIRVISLPSSMSLALEKKTTPLEFHPKRPKDKQNEIYKNHLNFTFTFARCTGTRLKSKRSRQPATLNLKRNELTETTKKEFLFCFDIIARCGRESYVGVSGKKLNRNFSSVLVARSCWLRCLVHSRFLLFHASLQHFLFRLRRRDDVASPHLCCNSRRSTEKFST